MVLAGLAARVHGRDEGLAELVQCYASDARILDV
jgi:hypothetical protein